jgi:hypothetical protein
MVHPRRHDLKKHRDGALVAVPSGGLRAVDVGVWSQFRRWTRNGTWARALAVLHPTARRYGWPQGADALDGRHRHAPRPRLLQRRADVPRPGRPLRQDQRSQEGGGGGCRRPAGRGADLPASTHENRTTDLMLRYISEPGAGERLELAIVDRGVTAAAAGKLRRSVRGLRPPTPPVLPPGGGKGTCYLPSLGRHEG